MDIILRGIEESYIEKIEKDLSQIRRRSGKKISRNEYLKMLIKDSLSLELREYQKTEFDLAIDKLYLSNEKLINTITELNNTYENLLNFLISEVD